MNWRHRAKTFVILALLPWMGCTPDVPSEEVRVLAPSSLRHVLSSIGHHWSAETGQEITFTFDASSRLARQVEEGAPCELFISAAPQWVDRLSEQALVTTVAQPNDIQNRLVLVRNRKHGIPLGRLEDLSQVPRLALAGPNVPMGMYAREVLKQKSLVPQEVITGRNAAHVLRLIISGEADAGIIYATEALLSEAVEIVADIPAILHSPIQYEVGRCRNVTQPAHSFLSAIESPSSRALFKKAGFQVIGGREDS